MKGEPFMENMLESAKATIDPFGKESSLPGVSTAVPKAQDLGILPSTDILAVEQASISCPQQNFTTSEPHRISSGPSSTVIYERVGGNKYELVKV
jgi:uncharacterized Fe-S center protein